MKIRIFVCVLVSIACSVYAQDSECRVSDGSVGICKRFTDCKLLQQTAQIFRDKNASNKKKNAARNEILERTRVCYDHIGNKRCCSDCTTPDGKGGIRKDIRECDHLYKLIKGYKKADVQYVKTLLINNTLDVCCVPPPPEPKNDCDAQIDLPPSPESKCCGVDSSLSNKIVAYPWTILLEYKRNSSVFLECGGSLISNKHVLTAAHCIVKNAAGLPISVRVGEYDKKHTGTDCIKFPHKGVERRCSNGAEIVAIERFIVHPEYDWIAARNDIALIQLTRPVKYSSSVRPICLPSTDISNKINDKLIFAVSGWGKNPENAIRYKQSAIVELVDLQVCQNAYKYRVWDRNYQLWDRQICAGGRTKRDTCVGDSGGALMAVARIGGAHYELAGVASFGARRCGTPGVPDVYTRVHPYMDWIRHHVHRHQKKL